MNQMDEPNPYLSGDTNDPLCRTFYFDWPPNNEPLVVVGVVDKEDNKTQHGVTVLADWTRRA